MEKSSGLLILKDNKVLLCHPTNAGWVGTFSLPKGNNNPGEDNITAAIRETKEEIGVEIPNHLIDKTEHVVNYVDKKGKVYKKVYYYVVTLGSLPSGKLITSFDIPDVIPKEQLQLEEVDWAGFVTFEEARRKILWRFANEPFLE